jgi:hypothetical protein
MAGKNTYAFILVNINGNVAKKRPIKWIWSRPKCKQEMQVIYKIKYKGKGKKADVERKLSKIYGIL